MSYILIAILVVFIYIGKEAAKIWLADRAIFWYRGLENHSVIILKNGVRVRLIFFSSDNEKIEEMKNYIGDEEGVEIAQAGKILWIGTPWSGIKLKSWYMNPKDDDDPNTYPQYSLYMGERTWDYLPSEESSERKSFVHEWGVDTADPVQVVPKLSVLVQATNAVKAVFDVEHHEEAIKKIILKVWKNAVQNLRYFVSYEKDGKEIFETGDLQKNAQTYVNIFFYRDPDPCFTSPLNFHRNSLAWYIYSNYGFWVKKIMVRDIDPVDDKIREVLQNQIIAKTEAAAKVETASGSAAALKIETEAKSISTLQIGKAEAEVTQIKGEAEATAIQAKLSAKGKGLKAIAENLGIDKKDANVILGTEAATEMVKNSKYTYLSGQPGDIIKSIVMAADSLKKGEGNE